MTEAFADRLSPAHPTMAALWDARVRDTPDAPFLHCFETTCTFAEADADAGALAAALSARGVRAGDRIALYAQNDPLFAVGVLAAWKLACAAVPINPMNTARELLYHLQDSGATALITLPTLWDEVAAGVVADTGVHTAVVGSFQRWTEASAGAGGGSAAGEAAREAAGSTGPAGRDCGIRVETVEADLPARAAAPEGTVLLSADDLEPGLSSAAASPGPADPALLTYTSGTTGSPKGAINTHAGVVFNAEAYARFTQLEPGAGILAIAPLFHITGSVGQLVFAIRNGSPLVLSHRFHPQAMLESIRRWRPVFAIAAITAYRALADHPGLEDGDADSLTLLYSGGSPIPPALSQRLEGVFGSYIHNAFGMSETTSPLIVVPRGERAPVEQSSGSLSIGKPIYETEVRLVDDAGADVDAGEQGELWARGPQITPGYWGRPEATAETLTDGWLHTGDVGIRDAEGWIYLVDRKKDMINASGYKVWPREVEGVLYDHPAVAEAAVVGTPDEYRGETVRAYITLQEGHSVSEEELLAHCRENLSAYKRPASIEVLAEMPKTATGKIMRRSLRE